MHTDTTPDSPRRHIVAALLEARASLDALLLDETALASIERLLSFLREVQLATRSLRIGPH